MQIRSAMTSYCLLLKMIKYWTNDISGNIKAVFLKLGTINVHHKRNTMTPLMSLPWQQFDGSYLLVFCMKFIQNTNRSISILYEIYRILLVVIKDYESAFDAV